MGKKILGALLVLVLVVAGIAWYLLSNIDGIVKGAIEKYGSEIAGVPVSVGEVSIALREGTGSIRNLTIGNPPGFKGKPVFELGDVTLGIDLNSLGKQPTVISQVLIESPKVNVVANAKGQTNIDAIKKNIDSHSTAEPKEGTKAPDKTGPGADKAQPLLRIDKFTFAGAELSADLTAAGDKEYKRDIPALHLENLGGTDGGTPEQIAQQMMQGVTDMVVREVATAGVNSLIDRHLDGGAADAAKGAVKKFMEFKGD